MAAVWPFNLYSPAAQSPISIKVVDLQGMHSCQAFLRKWLLLRAIHFKSWNAARILWAVDAVCVGGDACVCVCVCVSECVRV